MENEKMAEISAATVMKLRKMSGQGMMDCKKALAETDGDLEEALLLLRKKGMATLAKRAGRETAEGRVVCSVQDDGKLAAMATLCCETDFVAKSEDFLAVSDLLKDYLLACNAEEGAENVLNTELDGKNFAQVITEAVSKTGEKTELADFARYALAGSGIVGTYVHFNSKIGAMVEIESDNGASASDELKQLAVDIAMHITAINPASVDNDGIDPAVIEKEKAIAAEQVKDKPANIIDKIIEGKMKKFYAENCLISQAFVKDDKKTVAEVLAATAGDSAKIKRFVRFEIG